MGNYANAWPLEAPTLGRKMIMTDAKEITRENIIQITSSTYSVHQMNAVEENFLIEYERGNQAILDRKKEIRPEINAKVVVNNAAKIVDTHVGYCFSNPITLVQRARVEADKSDEDGRKDDLRVSLLNKMMQEQAKGTKDMELARNLFICGVGYQMVLPTRKKYKKRRYSPFEILVPNPVTTFVVYSNDAYREPVLGCTYAIRDDGEIELTAYSERYCYEIRRLPNALDFELSQSTQSVTPNPLGMIPIIEFSLNDRMGIFEKAIPIMDAINLIDSDRINDIMQHVQSLLWMHNCQIDEEGKKELQDGGVIVTKSTGDGKEAKITYLGDTLNESEVQKLVDHLKDELEQITATPSWKEASGGSTTGAMQLSNGWQCLEISAKSIEQFFIEPELQLLDLAIQIINMDGRPYDGVKDIELADIEVRFCRTKTYDLVSKTNALVSLINAGVDGLTAFNTVALFTDSQQAYLDSKRIIEGMQEKLIKKDTNIIKGANAYTDKDGNGGIENDKKDPTEESLQPSKVAGVTE